MEIAGQIMRAAVFEGPEKMSVKQVPKPECGEGEVLVEVKACAVCGTDIRIYYHGQKNVIPPHIIGHEVAGTIAAVGKGVSGYEPGEPVTLVTSVGCGKCRYCQKGYVNLCPRGKALGYFYPGGFAEYIAVPREAVAQDSVLKLPQGISFEEAAIVEPLSCCINGQDYLQIEPGETVAVFGAGPVGRMHAELARAAGAAPVIVIDLSPQRLELAKGCPSIDYVVDVGKDDPVEKVLDLTREEGADVAIVACSSGKAQQQALALAAKKGRVSFFAGLPKDSGTIDFDSNILHYKEISVFGAFASYREQYLRALELVASGKVVAKSLITHRFPLDKIVEAIQTAKSGVGLKVVITNEA